MVSLDDLYGLRVSDLQTAVDVLDDAFSDDSQWKEVFKNEEKNRIVTEIMVRF